MEEIVIDKMNKLRYKLNWSEFERANSISPNRIHLFFKTGNFPKKYLQNIENGLNNIKNIIIENENNTKQHH